MLKKILGTIGTRYLIALLNLALIFINAKVLGVEGVGLVGILLAAIGIAAVVNGVLSGNTIVYFMNRYSPAYVLLPAYVWPFVGSAVACAAMRLLGMFPREYTLDVYLLSLLSSFITVNARILLGRDRIAAFNVTYMLQSGGLFFVLVFFYCVAGWRDVASYVRALHITYAVAFLGSLALLAPLFRQEREKGEKTKRKPMLRVLREMFAYGLWGSADNIAEVLTTRLNYFLIQRFAGLWGVGLLDAGTKISESVWHISRSVSFIEYGSVAQTTDADRQKRTTLRLFKLTFSALTAAILCILLIPEWVYTDYLFSSEFTGMRSVIIALSTGIVALGCNSILSHYFIGSGKIRFSAASSFVGLLTLSAAGYVLIPLYGVTGAAASSSIAFSAMLAFSITVFCRTTHTRIGEFIPRRADANELAEHLRRMLSRRSLS